MTAIEGYAHQYSQMSPTQQTLAIPMMPAAVQTSADGAHASQDGSLQAENELLKRKIEKLRKQVSDSTAFLELFRQTKTALEQKEKDTNQLNSRLESREKEIQTLKQQVSAAAGSDQTIAKLQQELKQLRQQTKDAEESKKQMQAAKMDLLQMRVQVNKLNAQLQASQQRCQELEKKQAELEASSRSSQVTSPASSAMDDEDSDDDDAMDALLAAELSGTSSSKAGRTRAASASTTLAQKKLQDENIALKVEIARLKRENEDAAKKQSASDRKVKTLEMETARLRQQVTSTEMELQHAQTYRTQKPMITSSVSQTELDGREVERLLQRAGATFAETSCQTDDLEMPAASTSTAVPTNMPRLREMLMTFVSAFDNAMVPPQGSIHAAVPFAAVPPGRQHEQRSYSPPPIEESFAEFAARQDDDIQPSQAQQPITAAAAPLASRKRPRQEEPAAPRALVAELPPRKKTRITAPVIIPPPLPQPIPVIKTSTLLAQNFDQKSSRERIDTYVARVLLLFVDSWQNEAQKVVLASKEKFLDAIWTKRLPQSAALQAQFVDAVAKGCLDALSQSVDQQHPKLLPLAFIVLELADLSLRTSEDGLLSRMFFKFRSLCYSQDVSSEKLVALSSAIALLGRFDAASQQVSLRSLIGVFCLDLVMDRKYEVLRIIIQHCPDALRAIGGELTGMCMAAVLRSEQEEDVSSIISRLSICQEQFDLDFCRETVLAKLAQNPDVESVRCLSLLCRDMDREALEHMVINKLWPLITSQATSQIIQAVLMSSVSLLRPFLDKNDTGTALLGSAVLQKLNQFVGPVGQEVFSFENQATAANCIALLLSSGQAESHVELDSRPVLEWASKARRAFVASPHKDLLRSLPSLHQLIKFIEESETFVPVGHGHRAR